MAPKNPIKTMTLTLCLQPKSGRFCKEYWAPIGLAPRVKELGWSFRNVSEFGGSSLRFVMGMSIAQNWCDIPRVSDLARASGAKFPGFGSTQRISHARDRFGDAIRLCCRL